MHFIFAGKNESPQISQKQCYILLKFKTLLHNKTWIDILTKHLNIPRGDARFTDLSYQKVYLRLPDSGFYTPDSYLLRCQLIKSAEAPANDILTIFPIYQQITNTQLITFCNCYLRAMTEKILIIDFGSQYTQLIARRVHESEVYCEIVPYNKIPALTDDIKGIILSGSPASVARPGCPESGRAKPN